MRGPGRVCIPARVSFILASVAPWEETSVGGRMDMYREPGKIQCSVSPITSNLFSIHHSQE